MAKTYNVFISHSWDHVADLKSLKRLLESRGYFKVEFQEKTPDNPIDSANSAYIKTVLRRCIENSDVVLALAGVYASHSGWMAWELNEASSKGIPIIGVVPWGQERVSKIVQDKARTIVRWNTESIVDAIRLYAK